MCQPNNCVAVLQRLRGGWQVCQMQTPKPLKRNSTVHLSSSISRAQDHRKPPKKVSISEWLQCNFDYCNHLTLLDRRGAFKAHPTHKKGQGAWTRSTAQSLGQNTGVWQPESQGQHQSVPPRALGGCCCRLEGTEAGAADHALGKP